MSGIINSKRVSVSEIRSRKNSTDKIVASTAYDYTFAKIFDPIVDVILVGDSLGMVIKGEPNTLSVTVDEIIYHSRSVSKALKHAHLVADMPFMSYQPSMTIAIKNAGRLLAEGKAESVKLEGGRSIARTVLRLVENGIPVMGHIGLQPQSVHAIGGYRVQGKTECSRNGIIEDALALEEAGVYSIVIEGVPSELAKEITSRIRVPTIGIGAGPHCDGQILVGQDLLGMNPDFNPRFVKNYANIAGVVQEAMHRFSSEVKSGDFPGTEHSF